MQTLDIVVLTIYVAGVVAFGCFFYKRSSTSEGFTSANGRLPGWVVGLSIFGTYLSSISFLALPGKAFASNWNAFAFSLSLPFAAYVAVRWFAPLYRSAGDISAYAYLERRFGLWARLYAVVCYLLTQFARMGTILFLVAIAMERLTGWDITTIIIVAGILVTLYTVIGGIEAVIWTDAIQSAVLTLGALFCAGSIIFDMPEGPSQLFTIASNSDKFSLGSFTLSLTDSTFWLVLIYGMFINLQNFGIDQSYIQRYHTAKSLAEAQKSIWIGALTYVPVSALFLFLGSALFSYYTVYPNLLPENVTGDRVFPYFIATELPPGGAGLLIAALFAAAMSSIDTSLNSSSTIIQSDIYLRFINKTASETQKIKFLRVTTIVMGAAGTACALLMISIKSALDVWWSLAGIFSGGMLGLFLLGALSRRTESPQAVTGVIIGILVIVWATFSHNFWFALANPFHSLMTTVIGTLAIFFVGMSLSRKNKRRKKGKPAETLFDL
ncbi:Predicted sialic acid transporter [hydrothermal vent metagenome]|uniref:Predicted sialic acid transporter n=1 Tax=hydrothermal vent metagenome TaxID=652676 RepID=A0A3B1D2M8_9ZZZZ